MSTTDPIGFGVVLSIVAIAVVFATLAALAAVISGLTWLDRRFAAATSPVPAPVPVPLSVDAIPPELLVVLAAAATAATGRPVRVHRVVILGQTKPAWIAGGRSTIMGSHRPHMHKTSGRS